LILFLAAAASGADAPNADPPSRTPTPGFVKVKALTSAESLVRALRANEITLRRQDGKTQPYQLLGFLARTELDNSLRALSRAILLTGACPSRSAIRKRAGEPTLREKHQFAFDPETGEIRLSVEHPDGVSIIHFNAFRLGAATVKGAEYLSVDAEMLAP
jgi:hypothetical protein